MAARKPKKLDYKQIMDRLSFYKADPGLTALKERCRDSWYPLVKGTRRSPLPEDLTRGYVMQISSPRLMDLSESILSVFASYKTTTTAAARGKDGSTATQPQKGKADETERFLTVARSQYSRQGRNRRTTYSEMLYGMFSVSTLTPTEDGYEEKKRDPFACYFPPDEFPFQPPILLIDYEILVDEAEEKYGESAYNTRRNQKPTYDGETGRWNLEALGQEVATDGGEGGAAHPGGAGYDFATKTRVVECYDKYFMYHVLCNKAEAGKDNGGEVVYCEPHYMGGCPAFIVSGSSKPFREVDEKAGPALWPVMQTVYNRNLLRTAMMYYVLNAKKEAFVEVPPQVFQDMQDASILRPVGANLQADVVELAETGRSLIKVNGSVVPWEFQPTPYLEALDAGWKEEEEAYISAWKEPTDPTAVGDATATAYLTATEVVRLRQTSLLVDADKIDQKFGVMILSHRRQSGKPMTLYSNGESVGDTQLPVGLGLTLSPQDLEDFDPEIAVTTKSQTASERRALTVAAFADAANGYGTMQEVFETKYVDATAAQERMAEDTGYRLQRPTMLMHAYTAYKQIVLEELGIIVPDSPMGTSAPTQQANPPGMPPMQPAAINAGEGGAGGLAA